MAADTNCNKENSNSVLDEKFHSVIKRWIEGGGPTENLWNICCWRLTSVTGQGPKEPTLPLKLGLASKLPLLSAGVLSNLSYSVTVVHVTQL